MLIQCRALWALGFLLTAIFSVRAAEPDDAKIIIDKAIKAGGGEKLAKFDAITVRFKGTIHQMDMDLTVRGEIVAQGDDQRRFTLEAEGSGMKFKEITVLNRDKGWCKFNDEEAEELEADELADLKEVAYANGVGRLNRLKEKSFMLSSLGESKVNNRPALGVRVSSKGHQDVNLYFDKETYLLVKTEGRVKDFDSGMEVYLEQFYCDFKEINGILEATKTVMKRDGKTYLETTDTETKHEEKLDDSVFAKP